MKSSFTTSAFRVAVAGGLVVTALGAGCQGGEVLLPGLETEGGNGGRDGTGGATEATGGRTEGGSGSGEEPSSGSGGSATMTPDHPPCSVTDDCFSECDADPDACACDTPADCSGRIPFCDSAQGRCTECLFPQHCVEQFGEVFPACSAGRCVQCQTDDDCPEDVTCVGGWCGTCTTDDDCLGPTVCDGGLCLPSDLPQ